MLMYMVAVGVMTPNISFVFFINECSGVKEKRRKLVKLLLFHSSLTSTKLVLSIYKLELNSCTLHIHFYMVPVGIMTSNIYKLEMNA